MTHLDTTFLVDAIRESRGGMDGPARRWLAGHRGESLALSVFVQCELMVGAELHAEAEAERRRIADTCGSLPVVLPDERLADTYARVGAGLAHEGETLATMDLLIAATALTRGASLLTANEAHFARVPGLRVLGYRWPPPGVRNHDRLVVGPWAGSTRTTRAPCYPLGYAAPQGP